MILKANCKINLGLDILRRRADGFHDLETVMFPVAGLYDEVEVVRTAAPGAEFRAEGLAVDNASSCATVNTWPPMVTLLMPSVAVTVILPVVV